MKVSIGKFPKSFNKERKIKVQIDPWDTWSMDHTLALIIHPMLIQLRNTKNSAGAVCDEDVPEELRSTSAPPKKNDWDTDENYFKRWDWVLDEMIWAFAQILDDEAENSFHTGNHDTIWEEVKVEKKTLYEMKKGPKDTHVFNKEGWEKWNARKQHGFKLFGKYYEALWD
jgi:hypothetical protein